MSAADNFRENLRTAMVAKGLSQTELADRLESSQPYINRVIRGVTNPSVDQAERISHAVGFPLIAMLGDPSAFSEAVLQSIPA